MPAPDRDRTARRTAAPRGRRSSGCGSGLVVIAMVLSFFGARLVQLQGIDPKSYAAMAAAEGRAGGDPARRARRHPRPQRAAAGRLDPGQDGGRRPGDDRRRRPGHRARCSPQRPRRRLLHAPCAPARREEGSRFEYVARRVPSTLATDVLGRAGRGRLPGHHHCATTRSATTRPTTWPPTCSASWAPTSRSAASSAPSTQQLAGTDGTARYQVGGGNRIPLGENTRRRRPATATPLTHHDRPRPAVVHPAGPGPDPAAVPARRAASRSSWTPAPASCWRWPTPRPSTPTTRWRPTRTTSAPARSATPTSRARWRRCSPPPR